MHRTLYVDVCISYAYILTNSIFFFQLDVLTNVCREFYHNAQIQILVPLFTV